MDLKDQVANVLPREAAERLAQAARFIRDRRLLKDGRDTTPSIRDALILEEVVQDIKRKYPHYFKTDTNVKRENR